MAVVRLNEQELEIIIDNLPPIYKEDTPKVVIDLKMKLMSIKEALEA